MYDFITPRILNFILSRCGNGISQAIAEDVEDAVKALYRKSNGEPMFLTTLNVEMDRRAVRVSEDSPVDDRHFLQHLVEVRDAVVALVKCNDFI